MIKITLQFKTVLSSRGNNDFRIFDFFYFEFKKEAKNSFQLTLQNKKAPMI